MSRGPRPKPPADSRSGSEVSAARISMVAAPTVKRAPGLRSSRASSSGSAAAPNAPSRMASTSASGSAGSSRAAPNSGYAPSTAFTSTSAVPPSAVRAIARIVAVVETRPARVEERALRRIGFAVDEREGEVAAEDGAAFAREPVAEARRERVDAGDRHHAERDAGDEHVEAAQSAAQVPQREAQRDRETRRRDGGRGEGHRLIWFRAPAASGV